MYIWPYVYHGGIGAFCRSGHYIGALHSFISSFSSSSLLHCPSASEPTLSLYSLVRYWALVYYSYTIAIHLQISTTNPAPSVVNMGDLGGHRHVNWRPGTRYRETFQRSAAIRRNGLCSIVYSARPHKHAFSKVENLGRLQRCLEGSASEVVHSRLLLPSAVPQVMQTLQLLYGRPEQIIYSLVQNVSAPKVDNLKTL